MTIPRWEPAIFIIKTSPKPKFWGSPYPTISRIAGITSPDSVRRSRARGA